jgi:hypothetical protein
MLHHYITRYSDDDGRKWAVSWIQVDLFGLCWCLSEKRVEIGAAVSDDPSRATSSPSDVPAAG